MAATLLALPGLVQAAPRRVLVLRHDEASTELNAVVDRELLRALADYAHFEGPYLSPTPFADIELAAGCQGRTDACLARVASTLGTEWLLVREIRRDESGSLVLSLIARDGESQGTRRTQGFLSPHHSSAPERLVPRLVGDLYETEVPEPVLAQQRERPGKGLRIAGFSAVAASGVLLSTGLAMATVGHKDHDLYARTHVYDAQSAERADHLLDDARRRVRISNALFATGAVVGVGGLSMLLWDHFRERLAARPIAVSVSATREGGFVALAGALGGSR